MEPGTRMPLKAWERVNWPAVAAFVWAGIVLGIAIHGFFWPLQHSNFTTAYAPAVHSWWANGDSYEGAGPVTGYRYGPAFLILLMPFAALPDAWGNAAWKALDCGFYALALGVAGTRLLPRRLSRNQLAALFLLAAPVSLESMHNGQATLIMLGAMLLGLVAIVEDRWNLAALCLALATLIKGYPLGLAMVLAVLYPRRFPVRFVAALGLLMLLPFALQTPAHAWDQTVRWLTHLTASTGVTRPEVSRSLDSLFNIYGNGIGSRTNLVLELLAGVAVLALSLWQARVNADRRVLLTRLYVFFAIWIVLFGPATESCTYVVAAPAIAWMVVDAFDRSALWSTRLALIASLLMMGPLVTDMPGQAIRHFAAAHGSQPLGALLLFCFLLKPIRPTPTVVTPRRQESEPLNAAA